MWKSRVGGHHFLRQVRKLFSRLIFLVYHHFLLIARDFCFDFYSSFMITLIIINAWHGSVWIDMIRFNAVFLTFIPSQWRFRLISDLSAIFWWYWWILDCVDGFIGHVPLDATFFHRPWFSSLFSCYGIYKISFFTIEDGVEKFNEYMFKVDGLSARNSANKSVEKHWLFYLSGHGAIFFNFEV